jgi:hypothetical protein
VAQTPGDKTNQKDKNELGISRTIYALGNSLKDALIWGTAVTVALIGILHYGQKNKAISKVADQLQKGHVWWEGYKKSKGMKGSIIAVPLAVGWLVGHVVQGFGAAKGWKQAQKAVDKYDNLVTERESLVTANAQLIEENQRYRAAVEKKPESFVEMAKQQGAEAGALSR